MKKKTIKSIMAILLIITLIPISIYLENILPKRMLNNLGSIESAMIILIELIFIFIYYFKHALIGLKCKNKILQVLILSISWLVSPIVFTVFIATLIDFLSGSDNIEFFVMIFSDEIVLYKIIYFLTTCLSNLLIVKLNYTEIVKRENKHNIKLSTDVTTTFLAVLYGLLEYLNLGGVLSSLKPLLIGALSSVLIIKIILSWKD